METESLGRQRVRDAAEARPGFAQGGGRGLMIKDDSTWNTCRGNRTRPRLVASHRRANRRRWWPPRDAGEMGGCVWGERRLSWVALIPLAACRAGRTDCWAQSCFRSRGEVIDGARQVLRKKEKAGVHTLGTLSTQSTIRKQQCHPFRDSGSGPDQHVEWALLTRLQRTHTEDLASQKRRQAASHAQANLEGSPSATSAQLWTYSEYLIRKSSVEQATTGMKTSINWAATGFGQPSHGN